MDKNPVKIKKKNLYGLIAIIFATILFLSSSSGILAQNENASIDAQKFQASAGSESKFAELSSQRTNQCSGAAFIDFKDEDSRLQGACCGAMDFHRYAEQVEGLKKYSYIDKIPSDPYDIPVSLAQELLDHQKTIKLTLEQQSVYDEAMNLSHEGGPCCCKCWRWYAFEGLAKYLITEHNFGAEQIAEVWDLEDGCGGPGHVEH